MARKRKRLFNVNYYEFIEVFLSEESSKVTTKEINISKILNALLKEPTEKRLKFINYEKVRLQEIYKIDNSEIFKDIKSDESFKNVWVLKFIKFKEAEIYGIADNKGLYNEEELDSLLNTSDEDNAKYIASPTVCLYDESKNVFAVARNSEGVQPGAIVEYLTAITNKRNIQIRAIKKSDRIQKDRILGYRGVDFRIENLRTINQSQREIIKTSSPTVYQAIRSVQSLGIDTVNINGISDTKNKKVIDEKVQNEIIALAALEIDNIKRLKTTAIVDGQRKVEKIDFLEDKMVDDFSIQLEKSSRIKSDMILEKLVESYKKKIDNVKKKGESYEYKDSRVLRTEVDQDDCFTGVNCILPV